MTNMKPNSMNTLEVLKWAKEASTDDEMVKVFWVELCKAVNVPTTASAQRVYNELRLYGGNTLLNIFRNENEFVSYQEVSYDVAKKLKKVFADARLQEGDVWGCESFVLQAMKVEEHDLNQLVESIRGAAFGKSMTGRPARLAIGGVVSQTVGKEVMKQVAGRVTSEVAKRIGVEVGKQVAARVALSVNVFFAAWTVVSIAGPATRVTIPGVTYVALLRRLHMAAWEEVA